MGNPERLKPSVMATNRRAPKKPASLVQQVALDDEGEPYEKTMKAAVLAFKAGGCNISYACEKVGISRRQWMKWEADSAIFQEWLEEAREGLIDFAEAKLIKLVNEESLSAIQFFLKAKGKNRGYVDRTELAGAGGGPVSIDMKWLEEELPRNAAFSAIEILARLEGQGLVQQNALEVPSDND